MRHAERPKAGSLWEDHGLVFATHGGRPLDSRNAVRTPFKPLLKRAGLPDLRFHDLRHPCATLLLSRGHHPKLVQGLLGHASVALPSTDTLTSRPAWETRRPPLWRPRCPKKPSVPGLRTALVYPLV